jgi:NAD/NADP transhydrogenase beta subunit
MNDYLLGSDVIGADPRAVKGISFAQRGLIVGADAAPPTLMSAQDTKKANITLAGLVAGAIIGSVAGAKLMKKSPVLGALIGLIGGAAASSASTAYYLKKEEA